ncbi:ribonuclease Z [uncultured Flavobacterium sp.]|uniref:ribonuclease Z n=1 Tax=uncultured Flavobacterium sp. TaxID=165435 RepID=UPI0030EEA53B|tara:strand:- start:2737 stop:3069 length:333 start_codon:yes stop_codon:yes gene_type:complete
MKVEQKGHISIIKDTQGSFLNFIEKLTAQFNTYKEQNLILDVTMDKNLTIQDFKLVKDLAKKHKKEKKTLVFVAENIDFNKIPDYLLVVPTVLEAHDIIEMEEIERDLGF